MLLLLRLVPTKNLWWLPVALLTESVLPCLTFKTFYNLTLSISAQEMPADLVRVYASPVYLTPSKSPAFVHIVPCPQPSSSSLYTRCRVTSFSHSATLMCRESVVCSYCLQQTFLPSKHPFVDYQEKE